MNVFMISTCPRESAQGLCDKHVVKMVLETAQLLSTAARERGHDDEMLYRSTHKHHPCTKAAIENSAYFSWLVQHGLALADEYTHRYGKTHKSTAVLEHVASRFGTEQTVPEDVPQAMPDEFKLPGNPTQAYQNYLRWKYNTLWKPGNARWTNRQQPAWSI